MPNSYVSNHVHIVFPTKERASVISEVLQPKLWAYLAGIATNFEMHAVSIGGTHDHVHAPSIWARRWVLPRRRK